MENLKNLINLTVGTEGNLDIPAYWMNKILTSISEKIEDLKKNTADVPTVNDVSELANKVSELETRIATLETTIQTLQEASTTSTANE